MHLRQPQHHRPHATGAYCRRRILGRGARVSGAAEGWVGFASQRAAPVGEAGAGADNKRPVSAGQRRAQRLDDLAVDGAVLRQRGEIMIERGVNNAIRGRHGLPQHVGIVYIALQRHRTGAGEGLGARSAARQPNDVMPSLQQLRHQIRADKPGGAGQENAHANLQKTHSPCGRAASIA